jgi:bifunctional non-homologous end joining protein LigD
MDGELCGVLPDGRTAFNLIQNALEYGDAALVYFVFDLLFLDGEDLTSLPLVDRKTRLEAFLMGAPDAIRYCDHQIGHGPEFYQIACQHGLEGIVSKRIDGRYNRTAVPGRKQRDEERGSVRSGSLCGSD